MKQGHNFGRVLEAVSPTVRGNVEKYMRKIDWADLTRECKGLFDKTIAALIDGLDSWLARTLASSSTTAAVFATNSVPPIASWPGTSSRPRTIETAELTDSTSR